MFSYACPHCAQRLLAPPERVGQRTMCPKCLRPVTIPTPELAARDMPDVVNPVETPDDSILGSDPGSDTPNEVTTPQPHGTRVAAATPAPLPPAANGAVAVRPTRPRSQMDYAADLSAVITTRMKPPPEPPSDLRPTTAAWLVLTVTGATLWLVGVVYEAQTLAFVALIGGLLAAFGYLWVAYLAGRRGQPVRGLVTLFPPVAAYRFLVPAGNYGLRPLWFFLTGLVFLTLAYFGPQTRAVVQQAFAAIQPVAVDLPPSTTGPVDRLRAAVDRRQPELLPSHLAELSRRDVVDAATADVRAEMTAELKKLAASDRPVVRAAAVEALAAWSPADAREPALAALKSESAAERRAALGVAGRWADVEVARAVAARLTDRTEQAAARDVLLSIGGPLAEDAVLPHLAASDDPLFSLAMIEVLEKVGGSKSAAALRKLAESGPNTAVRDEANRVAEALVGKK